MSKRGQQVSRTTGLPSLKQRIREALRSIFTKYHQPRRQVLADARRLLPRVNKNGDDAKQPNVFYQCADCKELYKATEVAVDHIVPVGTTPEWPCAPGEWEAWMARLLCDVENLRCLCHNCHRGRTNLQIKERTNGKHTKRSSKRGMAGRTKYPRISGKQPGPGKKSSKRFA